MLQTRNAKRPAQAAVRFAVDAVERGAARQGRRRSRRSTPRRSTRCCTRPSTRRPSTTCWPAAWPPRRARRRARSSSRAADAVAGGRRRARRRSSCARSPRPTTSPASTRRKGILTSEGGKASHAALVARGMGVPAVTGASDLEIDVAAGEVRVDGTTLHAGDRLAIDGTTGAITTDDVPLVEPEVGERVRHGPARGPTSCARCGVRANADTPEDARKRARVRRRGHRPVPHRAHVLRRGPPREDGRRSSWPTTSSERRERLDELAAAAAGRLRGAVRGDGGPAGHHPPARPAAARVPARRPTRPRCPRALDDRSSSARSSACRCRRSTRCSARAACRLGILYPEIYEMQVARDDARGQGGARAHRRRARTSR